MRKSYFIVPILLSVSVNGLLRVSLTCKIIGIFVILYTVTHDNIVNTTIIYKYT